MDQARARALLAGERARLQQLLQAAAGELPAAERGDEVDDADRRIAEQTGLAVDQLLRARWAALQRAESRLAAGSYGRSVRSGQPIPDERLEADPLAELTVQEAAAAEPTQSRRTTTSLPQLRAWASTSSPTTRPVSPVTAPERPEPSAVRASSPLSPRQVHRVMLTLGRRSAGEPPVLSSGAAARLVPVACLT